MQKSKKQIRKEILEKLERRKAGELFKKSTAIKEKLFSLPEFKTATFILFYASKEKEVSTDEMIDGAFRMGKRVALPRCTSQQTIGPKEIRNRGTDLEKGTYGIYEPKECQKDVRIKDIDLVVVPGLAFDRKNKRLGRGRGYYDRFLEKLARNKPSIGLAFDFQIIEDLPEDSHDIPVSKVITN